LQEGPVKNLLYKGQVKQGADLARFDMPQLKDDHSVGRSSDHTEREAYGRGYASGEKAGFEMGEQRAQVLLDKMEGLIRELTTLKSTIIKEVEQQCVELALSMARKVILREMTVKPDDIVKMAREGLLRLERTGQITIKVNPALYEFFTKHKPELISIHPDIVFDADPSVSKFGTVVMGPIEDVVTGVDEQLKNIIKDMVDRHASD
jgi:flagellar biosynthesis/type III secretory pathway protein FliH